MMPAGLLVAILCGLGFGTLLLATSASGVALLLVGASLALTLLRRPLWGLLLFALLATSIPYTTVNLGVRTTVSEAMLALTWGGVLLQAIFSPPRAAAPWRAPERILGWLMLFSLVPLLAGMVMVKAEGPGLSNWLRWLGNLSPLLLVPQLLRSARERDQLVVALLLGNLLMLLLSVGMFFKDRNAMSMIPLLESLRYAHPEAVRDIFSANYQRMASPWVHPNLTGGVLALFIPLALFYGWTRSGWRRALGMSVALLGCAGLLFSISRGAILALALVLLWLSFRRVPYSGRILGLGMVLAVALLLFYPPLQARLATMFSASNASTEIRFDEYARFPEAMARYPFGIGFKTDPPVPGSGLLGISNLWLNFIYKIGVPGMLLFVAVTVAWWREVRPLGAVRRITADNAIWLGCTAGVLAALLTGLFDHYFSFTPVLVALFWLLLGMALQQVRLDPAATVGLPSRAEKESP
jgi:hypothetical protein